MMRLPFFRSIVKRIHGGEGTDLPHRIAGEIEDEVLSSRRDSLYNTYTPGCFSVYLNEGDYTLVEVFREQLEAELIEFYRDLCQRRGYTVSGEVRIEVRCDSQLGEGAMRVDSSFGGGAASTENLGRGVAGRGDGDETRVFTRPSDGAEPEVTKGETAEDDEVRGRLFLLEGNAGKREYGLTGKRIRIGRDRSNDLVVFDPNVSRQHAVIELLGGEAVISDRGSTNGTMVNGRKIRKTKLTPGDRIRLGTTIFVYRL